MCPGECQVVTGHNTHDGGVGILVVASGELVGIRGELVGPSSASDRMGGPFSRPNITQKL